MRRFIILLLPLVSCAHIAQNAVEMCQSLNRALRETAQVIDAHVAAHEAIVDSCEDSRECLESLGITPESEALYVEGLTASVSAYRDAVVAKDLLCATYEVLR